MVDIIFFLLTPIIVAFLYVAILLIFWRKARFKLTYKGKGKMNFFGEEMVDPHDKEMNKSLREQISEILIKHHMPTRQVAINEIIQAITELIEDAQPEKKALELEKPRLFQHNPTLNEFGGYSSVPFYCSLCSMGEMAIQDNLLVNGNYHCFCSVWDNPTGGKWVKWFSKKMARKFLDNLPSEENISNQAIDEFKSNLLKGVRG